MNIILHFFVPHYKPIIAFFDGMQYIAGNLINNEEKNMNYFKLSALIMLAFIFISCTTVDDSKAGDSGTIDGVIVEIDAETYGIKGTAVPLSGYFNSEKSVKYKLTEESSKSLLTDSSYKPGDKIKGQFTFVKIKKGDWNTIIEIWSL